MMSKLLGVHREDDVRVALAAVEPVHHRPGLVHVLGVLVRQLQVLAGAGLVPDRPNNDRRVAPIALDHPLHPVDVGLKPQIWHTIGLQAPISMK